MRESFDGPDSRAHRFLRTTLLVGSAYDLIFALLTLVFPETGARVLSITLPVDQLYLRFTGVFLIMLALFYMLPAIHPGRYLGNVVVAIIGRSLGGLFLIAAVIVYGRPTPFLFLGIGDLVFAGTHAALLVRAEGGNPFRHYLR